jgi:hypothetical protein
MQIGFPDVGWFLKSMPLLSKPSKRTCMSFDELLRPFLYRAVFFWHNSSDKILWD